MEPRAQTASLRSYALPEDVMVTLQDYCARQAIKAGRLSPDYQTLWATIGTYVAGGGKRVRPYLVMLAYRAEGGTDVAATSSVAAAWELFHACLLIHDDVIDRDDTRHGRPNISGSYVKRYGPMTDPQTAHHLALSAAVLAGDLALSGSFQLILESVLAPEAQLTALRRLTNTMHGVAGGQLLDTEAILKQPADVDTSAINLHKTALYSFVDPLLAGAELADASDANMTALTTFGQAVGIGYQLMDDLLGVFGNRYVTGKSTDSDLREGKRTLLLQESLRLLSEVDQATLLATINGQNDNYDGARQLIEKSGVIEQIEARIETYHQQALQAIATLDWPADARQELATLAQQCLVRNA